jgi:hypothetical protein
MTDRELMQQALDALINAKGYIFHNVLDDKANQYDTAVEALRARLAQPEPTLALWNFKHNRLAGLSDDRAEVVLIRQREWQTLTENEIKHLWYEACQTNLELTSQLIVHLARNIEAKLKEKNT